MILYSPLASVTVVRLFSIRAGLDASTVTPGSTAPEESLAVPAMAPLLVPCALDTAGRNNSAAQTRMVPETSRLIEWPPWQSRCTAGGRSVQIRRGGAPEASVILA